jgi:hypothetical protein
LACFHQQVHHQKLRSLRSYHEFDIPSRQKSGPKAIETTAILYNWLRSREPECPLGGGEIRRLPKGIYYPVNVGDVFASKYQVVGKIGFGVTSTVWLAGDFQ